MMAIQIVSRVLVLFFGLTALLGVLWFAGSSGGETLMLPGVVMGFSSLVAVFLPQRKWAQRIQVVLCVVGIGAGLVLLKYDFTAPHVIEWDVVAMRFLHIAALATMAIMAFNHPTGARTS